MCEYCRETEKLEIAGETIKTNEWKKQQVMKLQRIK